MLTLCIVSGWCGNQKMIVADHIHEVLEKEGVANLIKHYSIWDNLSTPPHADLVLQLVPVYSEKEIGCPLVTIRRLLTEPDDPTTWQAIWNKIHLLIEIASQAS